MKLVMVHGRAQEGKNESEIKKEWLDALTYGLARADQTLPPEAAVEFPYYGDLLAGLVERTRTRVRAATRSRGPEPDGANDADLRGEILSEIAASLGLTEADIKRERSKPAERGPGNWEWVQSILRALDRVPGVNTKVIDMFTRDVFVYLTVPEVRHRIDKVVDGAIGDEPCVIIAHSLGTIIAYNVLRQRQGAVSCPRFVTVGSPLGIRAIKRHLEVPLESPRGIVNWFNAYDDRDLVALTPLDEQNFDVVPAIDNWRDVRNFTDDRHGVAGYLSDPVVAAKLVEHL